MSGFAALAFVPPLVAIQPLVPETYEAELPQSSVTAAETQITIDPDLAALNWSLPGTVTVGTAANAMLTGSQTQEGAAQQSGQQTEQSETDQEAGGNQIIVTAGAHGPPEQDPLMRVNERAFDVAEGVDQALVGPIAYAYEDALPSPIREGTRNFLQNLREPTNFINFLLQGKFGKAFASLGRFTINSTLGLGGIIDIAGMEGVGLPYRRTGFSDTMGFYGVGDGPFLVLPLIGSTTLRDLVGSGLDQAVLPFAVGRPFNTPEYGVPAYVLNSLNFRLEFDEQLQEIRNSDDPYVELREEYLAKRAYEIDLLKSGDANGGIPNAYWDYKQSQEAVVVDVAPNASATAAPLETETLPEDSAEPAQEPAEDASETAEPETLSYGVGATTIPPFIAPQMEGVMLLE